MEQSVVWILGGIILFFGWRFIQTNKKNSDPTMREIAYAIQKYAEGYHSISGDEQRKRDDKLITVLLEKRRLGASINHMTHPLTMVKTSLRPDEWETARMLMKSVFLST
jgi:hypothetical protein